MDQKKIDRINELSRKSRTPEGLTEAEKQEREVLRREYVEAFKRSLTAQLDNTYIVDEKGNKTALRDKKKK